MDAQIYDEIAKNLIGAIALDTSVFDAKQLRLETGLLRRVEQFRDSDDVQLLIPDVVKREVIAHLVQDAAKARTELQRAVRLVEKERLLPTDAFEQLQAAANRLVDPTVAAHERMAGWIDRTKAQELDVADRIDLRSLFDRYFLAQPPFADSGKKKHEFPDAAALLALEHWANERATKVLVVSTDPDWKKFCAESRRLVWVGELGDALSGFQNDTARFAARRLAELSAAGDRLGLSDVLLDALMTDDRIEFNVEASSSYEYEEDVIEPDFHAIDLPDEADAVANFEAVDHGDGTVAVRVQATAVASVASHFNFVKWDSIDREYMDIGSGTFRTDERIEFDALVTLGGDIPDRMTVQAVEILPTRHQIILDDIAPGWMRERHEDDYELEEEAN